MTERSVGFNGNDNIRYFGNNMTAESDTELRGRLNDQQALLYSGGMTDNNWSGEVGDTTNAMDDLLNSESFNNGRVPDISMKDNIKPSEGGGGYVIINDNQQSGVKGVVEENVLSDTFLSEMNTKIIQDTIRYNVYKSTNMVVDYQSPQELFIIMRSVLFQHANFRVNEKDLINEVKKLNKLVVGFAADKVSSNVKQYDTYIKDIQDLPTPIDRPEFSSSGSRNRTYDLSGYNIL